MCTYAPHTEAVHKAFVEDPITLLDDLIQFLTDSGHEDLASNVHDVLVALDSRRSN